MMLRFSDNLIMQTTLGCNLNCKYCMQGTQEEKNKRYHQKKITFEEAKNIIDTAIYERCILGNINNEILFHLHGGEVTLLGDELIKKIVNYILERRNRFPNLGICMQTNGLLLTEQLCKFFAENDISIGVSFDGFAETSMHNCFGNCNFLIKKLKDLEIKTHVKFGFLGLITKDNVKTIYKDFLKLSKIFPENTRYFGVNILCDAGNGSKEKIPTTNQLWKYYYHPILEDMKNGRKTFRDFDISMRVEEIISEILFTGTGVLPRRAKSGCFHKLCGFGSNMISIDPYMRVAPCDRWMENGPYIGERPLIDYQKSDFLGMQQLKYVLNYYNELFEVDKKYNCEHCQAKHICNGACQSYQKSIKGYADQDENNCNLILKKYNYIRKNWIYLFNDEIRYLTPDINPFEIDFSSVALSELKAFKKEIHLNEKGIYYIEDMKK